MNKNIVLFLACFIAPIALAIGALKWSWFGSSDTNYGEFLTHHTVLEDWQLNDKKWTIAMVQNGNCDSTCSIRKNTIKNIYDVLGKHNLRVGLINLSVNDDEKSDIPVYPLNRNTLSNDELYLIDHRGLIVLKYAMSYQKETDEQLKKGLIKDVKKLLNYSRSRA